MFTNKVKFLKNKKILITGYSSGIGKKTCLELLKMDATLILVGRKKYF